MSELAILVPKYGDEPPQRKRKLEIRGSSSSTVPVKSTEIIFGNDDCWEDDYIDPLLEEKYYRQVRESDGFDIDSCPLAEGGILPLILTDKYDYPYDTGLLGRVGLHCFNLQNGTNLKLVAVNKCNHDMLGRLCRYYITLEAMDTSSNFQTCVSIDYAPEESSLVVQNELSRLEVPSGPRTTPTGPKRRWKDDAVDDSYKGKMPSWLMDEELAAASNKWQFSELQRNDLLHMYAEFAFYSKWFGHGIDLRPFLPLEVTKIIVHTNNANKEAPHKNMETDNAIFYISFKGNGDPSGTPVEYKAVVRKTMDDLSGHICLEANCLAYKSNYQADVFKSNIMFVGYCTKITYVSFKFTDYPRITLFKETLTLLEIV